MVIDKFKVPKEVIDAVNRRLYALEYELDEVGEYPNNLKEGVINLLLQEKYVLYDFLRDHGGLNDGD